MAVLQQAPVEAMQFAQTLPRLIHTIINADLQGGPIFMSKIDLTNADMRV